MKYLYSRYSYEFVAYTGLVGGIFAFVLVLTLAAYTIRMLTGWDFISLTTYKVVAVSSIMGWILCWRLLKVYKRLDTETE